METKMMELTCGEAKEIISALSVADHESMAGPNLYTLAKKIQSLYPEALTNCEWMLKDE